MRPVHLFTDDRLADLDSRLAYPRPRPRPRFSSFKTKNKTCLSKIKTETETLRLTRPILEVHDWDEL